MLKNITRILPFFIVTLLSIGAVELFYGVVEHYLLPTDRKTAQRAIEQDIAAQPAEKLEKHTNYDVILQRNLFQSYAPEEEEPAPVTENPLEGLEATSLELVLMGTVSGTDNSGRAIILNKKNNEQDIYYRGDVVEDAEIKEILRGKVILSYQGKDEVLDMSEAASMRPPAAVAPTPERRRIVMPQDSSSPRRRVVPSDLQSGDFATDQNSEEEMNGGPEDFGGEIPEETGIGQPDESVMETGNQQDIPEPADGAEQVYEESNPDTLVEDPVN
ncbi:type II secretion system protein N [Desulfopila inferna]|uniref:type II secretion system protein N n=1 Tax=Desulfopila inferna TaxID=468528 RepID=UPI00196594DF|nr:type II secretion system protein N [Desulfopila inferna]MBM9606291.1 hypothetical protein [Desulfopila inferna]